MSRNNTAYCKVCQDAGKAESVYRSHFTRETRDPNSRVTCPTLLALECRYCFKRGHTVKYCSILKQKDMPKKTPLASKPAAQKPAAAQPKSKNPYICLESDSEEEEQKVSTKPIESFPQLCVPAKSQQHQANTYAAALLKPEQKPEPKPEPKPVSNSAPKLAPWVSAPSVAASPALAPVPPPVIIRNPRKCWADDTDSEDEEEQAAPITTTIPKNLKIVVPVVDEDW